MTQFKDKTPQVRKEGVSVGLFDYPILMAADILLYDTEKVPVGEDQVQHVELTRTLGKRFNSRFGDAFVLPEPYLTKEGTRIMGLDNPIKKMSKSAGSEYNYIAITDDAETIRKKIKKAVTDSGSEIVYDDDPSKVEAGKPALRNLINIYSTFADKDPKEIEKMYIGKGYADFKNDLAEVIIESLKPIQEKMKALSDEEVLKILRKGAEKVRPIAKAKLDEVKKKVGFIL
jgi:tryptophanyl-tRNA synthetase